MVSECVGRVTVRDEDSDEVSIVLMDSDVLFVSDNDASPVRDWEKLLEMESVGERDAVATLLGVVLLVSKKV